MRTDSEYKQLTIKEFTKAAEIYESDHAEIYEMCKDDYSYIASELEKEDYQDLLDCGCGTGPMISLLHEKNPGKHYTGVDITPKMIEAAFEEFVLLFDYNVHTRMALPLLISKKINGIGFVFRIIQPSFP